MWFQDMTESELTRSKEQGATRNEELLFLYSKEQRDIKQLEFEHVVMLRTFDLCFRRYHASNSQLFVCRARNRVDPCSLPGWNFHVLLHRAGKFCFLC